MNGLFLHTPQCNSNSRCNRQEVFKYPCGLVKIHTSSVQPFHPGECKGACTSKFSTCYWLKRTAFSKAMPQKKGRERQRRIEEEQGKGNPIYNDGREKYMGGMLSCSHRCLFIWINRGRADGWILQRVSTQHTEAWPLPAVQILSYTFLSLSF